MQITTNYSITRLFISKEIRFLIDNKTSFILKVPVIRDFYEDEELNGVLFLWTRTVTDAQKFCFKKINSGLDVLKLYIFEAVQFKEYNKISLQFRKYLELFIPEIQLDFQSHNFVINGLTITEEIWDYIIYLLKLTCGEKVVQPPTFSSPEARALWLAQQENEEKIRKLKATKGGGGEADGLMKAFLAITYKFPSFSVEYLFNQTMAQIQWLQKYAAGAVSYEVNAQACAAGNVKKGKKLDFFIK